MINPKSLNFEIQNLETFQAVARAYAEISSNRMKKNRQAVLGSRGFLEQLNEIFSQVASYYRTKVLAMAKKKQIEGKEKITFLAHNGKTVAVFLSANTGLYGDVIQKTFELFLKELRAGNYEATIVGKLGLSLFLQEESGRPYTYFDLPDYKLSETELSKIINHLVQYEEIRVYYGKFRNIVSQEPSVFNISANTPIPDIYNPRGDVKRDFYLFEPSIEQILVFFEEEIFGSIFEQAVSESELAKFAARMLAMDKASENIKTKLEKMKIERLRLSHETANKKQLNSFSSKLLTSNL